MASCAAEPNCRGAAAGVAKAAIETVAEGVESLGNVLSIDGSDDTVFDVDPETGMIHGDPDALQVVDSQLGQGVEEVGTSLGVRQLETMDMPKGNPKGNPSEQDEYERYQEHQERVDREAASLEELEARRRKLKSSAAGQV